MIPLEKGNNAKHHKKSVFFLFDSICEKTGKSGFGVFFFLRLKIELNVVFWLVASKILYENKHFYCHKFPMDLLHSFGLGVLM